MTKSRAIIFKHFMVFKKAVIKTSKTVTEADFLSYEAWNIRWAQVCCIRGMLFSMGFI
jgi:hypothetical protein